MTDAAPNPDHDPEAAPDETADSKPGAAPTDPAANALDATAGLVEVAIVGVQQADDPARGATVTLRDPDGAGEVQVVMAAADAAALSDAMGDVARPRPRTHDLLASLARAVGAEATRAAILRRHDNGVFEAEVVVRAAETEHRLDCRPSDALNLALRAPNCTLWVAWHLLEPSA